MQEPKHLACTIHRRIPLPLDGALTILMYNGGPPIFAIFGRTEPLAYEAGDASLHWGVELETAFRGSDVGRFPRLRSVSTSTGSH